MKLFLRPIVQMHLDDRAGQPGRLARYFANDADCVDTHSLERLGAGGEADKMLVTMSHHVGRAGQVVDECVAREQPVLGLLK
eukprot:6190061-Pleurochrysis_carterae.AAC.3